jgi:hypothetical protein
MKGDERMLTVTIPATELFNDETQKFINTKETTLTLEHSLVSLSKWEQKFEKPFLGKEDKTTLETLEYIRCMTLSPENPPEVIYNAIPAETLTQISDYINAKMTATWFNEAGPNQKSSSEVVTAEIIYYWLVALQIDFQVQDWHLNRLLTLIRVVNIKNDPKKKMMPKRDAAAQQRMLNEQRRAKFGTSG